MLIGAVLVLIVGYLVFWKIHSWHKFFAVEVDRRIQESTMTSTPPEHPDKSQEVEQQADLKHSDSVEV